MAAPRVSVVCIFYNEERFIAEAIDSVLAQDFGDWELLLVDDGSTDGGTAIARRYAASHPDKIRYIEHPGHENRGMSATRNLGLDHARGEFVAYIDSDDVWRSEKLREQVAILDAQPGVAMVCGTVNYWDSWEGGIDRLVPTGHVVDKVSRPPDTSLRIYPLGRFDAPCPSDTMMRRSAVEAVGRFQADFTGDLQMYEDQAFYAKLYLVEPVYFASRVWLDYRQHMGSCVATVTREGRYSHVRRHFLSWFRDYVTASGSDGAGRVRQAIDRAIWGLDHPLAMRVLRRLTPRSAS